MTVNQILTSAVKSRASHILVTREARACEVLNSTTTALCIGNTSESIWVQGLARFTFTVKPRNLIHTDLAAVAIADEALIVVYKIPINNQVKQVNEYTYNKQQPSSGKIFSGQNLGGLVFHKKGGKIKDMYWSIIHY